MKSSHITMGNAATTMFNFKTSESIAAKPIKQQPFDIAEAR